MRWRTPERISLRVTLLPLGAAIIFAFAPFQARAQRPGFSAGGHTVGRARAPQGRGGTGGYGGWTNRGGTWMSYTYSHGGHQGRSFRGRGYGGYAPLAAVPQPLYVLPFNYGLGDFDFDMNDNGPDYANSAPPPPGPDPAESALEMNQAAMAHQLQQLRAEIEDLQSAQPPSPAAPAEVQPESASQPPQPSVTLVLRNGQQLKVDDYAIMNGTLWDFNSRPLRKIPLSSIDIPASQKATEANGGEFPAVRASR